ncbi:hypothetical protein MMC25_005228 [Agyrium rufum]|nr:hypothetical protein [Agyrium rufum]
MIPGTLFAEQYRVESLWKNVGSLLKDCQNTVTELEQLLQGIVGKATTSSTQLGGRVGGKINNLKKAVRLDMKDDKFKKIRWRFTNYQISLQVLLTAITLAYTRSTQGPTDPAFGQPFQKANATGLELQSQLASLQLRLAAEDSKSILEAVSIASAVASLISVNKYFIIPEPVSSIFTGRGKLLVDLQGYFDVVGNVSAPICDQKRFIVHGLGGSGKTQFCCKFAQQTRQNFWGVFSIDATSHTSVEYSSSKIAEKVGVKAGEGSTWLRTVKDWLSSLDYPWLLLIDNADDPSICLEDYYPACERGCILVTTRDPMKRVQGTVGPRFYHFEKLEADEASSLLLKAADKPQPWDDSVEQDASCIATTLGFLPLALVQAGTAIRNGLCSLANYVDEYHKSWQRIRLARKNIRYKGSDTTYWSVYSSYELNLRSLETSDTGEALDAVELLRIFSFFYLENINIGFLIAAALNPEVERQLQALDKEEEQKMTLMAKAKTWKEYFKDRLTRIIQFATEDRGPPLLPAILRNSNAEFPFDELRLRQALGTLSRMSLVAHNEAAESYSMHTLVHTWVRERPEMSVVEQALWCEIAANVLTYAILLPPHGSLDKDVDMRKGLLPHIYHVQHCQKAIQSKIAINRRSRRFSWMTTLETQFGRRQAIQFAKFSRVYQECGDWKKAEELQVIVKDYVCGRLGNEHAASISIMLFLSSTYWNQMRTNDAAALQEQAYQACLKSLGPDHPRTLKIMDMLGSSKCYQGRFRESLELHEKAIAGMQRNPLTKEEDLYLAIGNLGGIQSRYWRWEEARENHTQAFNGLKRLFGPIHLHTLQAMEGLSQIYLQCGDQWLEKAHELMVEAHAQRESRLGKEHPYTLLAVDYLARTKSALGHTKEAEELYRQNLPVAERIVGPNHIGTLAGKARLAQVLVKQKKYAEAEELLLLVSEKQRYKSVGRKEDGDSPDRILVLWFLIECYEVQGKVDDALVTIDELERVLSTIGGQGLGKLHPIAQRSAAKRAALHRVQQGAPVQDNTQENLISIS